MIMEAIKYMILGMSVVFAFLYLLTIILDLQHKIIEKYFKEEPPKKPKKPSKTSNKKEKLKKVAAIAAAIHHQRTQNGN